MTIPNNYYDLVLIGSGYSVSTYITMADFSVSKRIAIVGGTDSWADTVRGTGVINHSRHLLAREVVKRSNLTDLRNSLQPSREDLANSNAKIIRDFVSSPPKGCTVTYIKGIVSAIGRESIKLGRREKIEKPSENDAILKRTAGDVVPFYDITFKRIRNQDVGAKLTEASETIHALKVVYGGGAGPHTPPMLSNGEWQAINIINPKQGDIVKYPDDAVVMDLDTFMVRSKSDSNNPLTAGNVALVGPNAGIDAAIEALSNDNLNLFWLIRGAKGVKPAWLPSKHYTFTRNGQVYKDDAAIKYAEGRILNYKSIEVAASNNMQNPIRLTVKQTEYFSSQPGEGMPDIDNHQANINIKYYVFAIGQNPSLEERKGNGNAEEVIRIGAQKVLKPVLNYETLTPIYDRNQRYGRWFETAVALQDKFGSQYQGLQVVGAAALALAGRGTPVVEQNYITHQNFGKDYAEVESSACSGQPAIKYQESMTKFDQSKLDREYYRLSDYFDDNTNVPSVINSMMNLVLKLNQLTIGAGDQLGSVRSQIAALTGYDLIAANAGEIALQVQIQELIDLILDNRDKLKQANQREEAFNAINKSAKALYSEMTLKWDIAYSDRDPYLAPLSIFFRDKMLKEMSALNEFTSNNYSIQAAQEMSQNIPVLLSDLYYLLAGLQEFVAEKAVDFNGMDRTELAVYLAAVYPKIKPEDWPSIIEKIILGRNQRPTGYDSQAISQIKAQLSIINGDPRKAATFTAP